MMRVQKGQPDSPKIKELDMRSSHPHQNQMLNYSMPMSKQMQPQLAEKNNNQYYNNSVN